MRPLRVAVAGCGPAGMAAALLLARAGHAVTVFERFEAPRPLGSGLMIQPTGLAVLDQLGLAEPLTAVAAPIRRLFGRAMPSGAVALDVSYSALGRAAGCGWGVHRATLFGLLHEAVLASEVQVVTGRTVTGSTEEGARRRLTFSDGSQSEPFDLIVDALGHGSTLAPPCGRPLAYGALWASLDWPDGADFREDALEQRYRAAHTMVGVMPIGRPPDAAGPQAAFFWSLRTDQLDAWREAGLDSWKAQALALWPALAPLLAQLTAPEQLTFARYTHRTLARPFGPALVHVGDSWRSTSPQLGQGANMALLDAYALALALRDAADLPVALRRYARLRSGHMRAYQIMSRLFTPVFQSDSRVLPFVRDRLVGPLARLWPATAIQAAMVAGAIGAPLNRLGLRAGQPASRSVRPPA